MRARVIEERCVGCGACISVCPQRAIEMVGKKNIEKIEGKIDELIERISKIRREM
ncbi:MAG TPA: 4Fe-4S dicluster domain-containing protein [Thermoplasmatales archaeon]|nr:4Fe-4S dicluster domain-containing protein [Thermoplasmatales archaeon]